MNPKSFDCVQMKGDIQRKLMNEECGLSVEARNRRAEEKALSDPILGAWFCKVKDRRPKPAAVAESQEQYRTEKRRGKEQ